MDIVDCHHHILPDIDDGAVDMAMAIEMAKIAYQTGTSAIIATPHHGNGAYNNERPVVLKAIEALQSQLDRQNIAIKLYPGSELHISPELIQGIIEGELLTYADQKKAVLIEFPKHVIPIGSEIILDELLKNNIIPVIAHPERNFQIARTPQILENWVHYGCLVQLTAMSVVGDFGKDIQQLSSRWLSKGCVHFIASDAHRPQGRAPNLDKAYQYVIEQYGYMLARTLFIINPNKLLSGDVISNNTNQFIDLSSKNRKSKSGSFLDMFKNSRR